METNQLKNELSLKSKNGISFLLSATIIWTIFTVIFILPIEIEQKNIFMLMTTGLMFPLAVLASKLIKVDWKFKNALSDLGLFLNVAQFMYFPIIFLAFINSPYDMLPFFAIITGAHLFPYGWLYNTKAYYVMAPVISVTTMILNLTTETLWIVPLVVIIFIILLISWLSLDYKKKYTNNNLSIPASNTKKITL